MVCLPPAWGVPSHSGPMIICYQLLATYSPGLFHTLLLVLNQNAQVFYKVWKFHYQKVNIFMEIFKIDHSFKLNTFGLSLHILMVVYTILFMFKAYTEQSVLRNYPIWWANMFSDPILELDSSPGRTLVIIIGLWAGIWDNGLSPS